MQIFKDLMNDECGMIMSAEAVMVGTVGVLGATVGLSAMAQSVNDELVEVAYAFRSLDQSYSFEGSERCGARVAGSHYKQQSVEKSINQLCQQIEEAKKSNRHEHDHHRGDHHEHKKDDQKKREVQKRKPGEKKSK